MAMNKKSKKLKDEKPKVHVIRLKHELPEGFERTFPFFDAYHDSSTIGFHEVRKAITLKDKGASIYSLDNDLNKEIVCYCIDGKLISSTEVNKCDYALYSEDDHLILIELKGSNYGKALDQISATIDLLVKNPHVKVSRLCGRVVLNKARVPDFLETKEKKLKDLLARSYKGNLKKCSLRMNEKLSSV